METKEQNNGFFEVFISKLKEQSFVIVLMLVGLYFQNSTFNERITYHKALEEKQQEHINKLIEDERNRLLQREKYLIDQRDKFVDEVMVELKNRNQK
jgi:pheromone shutdown protein TraB